MGGAKMLILILTPIVIFISLFGIAFMSIVWTRRPDLSVLDVLRESMKELKNRYSGSGRKKEDRNV